MSQLSLILVNYNATDLLARCLASVPDAAGSLGPLEIVVVDNRSEPAQRERLRDLGEGIRLHLNAENLGFARAANQGAALSTGEYICFLNPDTRLLPGALERLVRALARSEVGAAAPRVWWDDARTWLLPPPGFQTLLGLLMLDAVTAVGPLARGYGRRRLRQLLAYWQAAEPLPLPALTGTCLMTRRDVLERVGLFDHRFALYWEDADWSRRARRAGFTLLYVPEAEVVHDYNQSARTVPCLAHAWARASETSYLRKHYGRLGLLLRRLARATAARVPPPLAARPTVMELGRLKAPPAFAADSLAGGPYLAQIAYEPLFFSPAATLSPVPRVRLPEQIWERLAAGTYYGRIVALQTGAASPVWRWQKA